MLKKNYLYRVENVTKDIVHKIVQSKVLLPRAICFSILSLQCVEIISYTDIIAN
jgi:hypothetical protein